MLIFFSVLVGVFTTGVILGFGYLIYESLQDSKKPLPKKSDVPAPKLRFKKPQ